MTEKEILSEFIDTLKEKLKKVDSILNSPDELTEDEITTLKKVFHALKGNLVALHYKKDFVNEYGEKIHSLLLKKESAKKEKIKPIYNEFIKKVQKELL
ncbi:MAG: hypothetical protein ACQESP_04510 [Candidatus Muiribacteriota bacterium]